MNPQENQITLLVKGKNVNIRNNDQNNPYYLLDNHDNLIIYSHNPILDYELFNSIGNKITTTNYFNNHEIILPKNQYPFGLYLLNIKTHNNNNKPHYHPLTLIIN